MRYLILGLTLLGVLVSVLALGVHYSTATEPCSINERWDCGVVNHSSYAELMHVPVAAIGIAGYLALGALSLTRKRFALFLAALLGFEFALRLSFIEEYALHVWCLYCVMSQIIISLITLLALVWLMAEFTALKRAKSRNAEA